MRTTLDLDEDVLTLARGLAESHKISLGEAVSHLARRGAQQPTPFTMKDGFPVFSVDPSTPKFGPEDVQAALDAEDLEYARHSRKPEE
jgi:hypothetical protein